MKTKLIMIALVIALALLSLSFVQTPKPARWEYRALNYGTISEKKLNELGAEGWELVGTASPGNGKDSFVVQFIFKRAQ